MSKNVSEENFESLSMDWKPCTFGDCMKTTYTKPEPTRCYHREGCDHQEGCGCHNYTSPSVTRSKIGAVLHLCIKMKSGKLGYLDMDLTAPNFSTSNIDSYDGSPNSYWQFLRTSRPVGWREEMSKLEDMTSAGGISDVTRSVRIRCISPGVVIPSQTLLFLIPTTL